MLEDLQNTMVYQIALNQSFMEYTNVRRRIMIFLNQLNPDLTEKLASHLNPDILVFMVTDPVMRQFDIF